MNIALKIFLVTLCMRTMFLLDANNDYGLNITYVPGSNDYASMRMVQTNISDQHLPMLKTTPGGVVLGLLLSVGFGAFVGICYGATNKIAIDEFIVKDYKKIGKFVAWFISPISRALTMLAITATLQSQGISVNVPIAQLLAQTFDWLVYFEKIKIPYIDLEQKKAKEKQEKISLQTDSGAVL